MFFGTDIPYNLFENETFDWFAFNASIISKYLTGKRKAIAIDPSYIPQSGKKTPWIGSFWSGCAGEYKRGLEIMGIGVIDIDNHECMTLGSIQTPDGKTLDNIGKNLVDWYGSYLISRKDKLQSISKTLVADAFFSKETFITPMRENDFHVISRFRNDVILYYPTLEKNWNFALEMESSMQESQTVSQPTSKSWIFTSMHRWLLLTWPKRHARGSE